MRVEVAVAFLAGLFGLIPLMVQIATTRAQRRDRMTRLTHLRAELELLERLNTLQGLVSAGDEAAKHQMNVTINNALSNVLGQYNKLSEIAPSAVVGGKRPSPRQLSFLRRALLLYAPNTALGWILHTIFYVFGIIFVMGFLLMLDPPHSPTIILGQGIILTPLVLALLSIRYVARRHAAHHLEETAS